ncbi:hypothetical protein [Nocardiopsis sp. NPDC057823]|uniref:hypothetical protein n=1 Tax=Nocardiopsis sp. NPDC057823 TaxID=3346256 RepID=UPI00366C8E92
MGEHAAHGNELTAEILDQIYPLAQYSPEERLKALLCHLILSNARNEAMIRRTFTEVLGIPEPVTTALLHGDIHALQTALAESKHEDRWPLLASALAYGDGLNAAYGVLAAIHAEFEELQMPPTQRRKLPISRAMLDRRGYQSSSETFLENPAKAATDPRLASSAEELLQTLKCLRVQAGEPTVREIAQRSEDVPEGADATKHLSRSYNTIHKVLKDTDKLPSLVSVLAFVRGCGVLDLDELNAWEQAWVRIAMGKHSPAPPRPGEQGWRSPTGPNPSLA